MTAKSSGDDPMDLGPFLQNYVMKNPFKAQEVSSTVDGRGAAAAGDRAVVRLAPRRRGSWPRLNAGMRARRLGDKACLVNGVDNNNVCAESANLLVHNDEISPGDVTAWLRDNYRYLSVPNRHRLVAQHLLLSIQQVFPQVTRETVDEFVMAAFPGCTKVKNRKNGLAFYQGLFARPDPEMYRNPLFVAALDSVTSRLLTTGQASEKFGIRESALIAAVSWCDADQPCDAVPTSSAVTRSTSSLQINAVRSTARQKRVHLTDSEQDSLDEPQCRRYRSSIEDAVDFEMMLQDISSNAENLKSECSVSQSVSENGQTLSQEHISIKTEPGSDSSEEQSVPADSQPLNFSLSVNSLPNSGTHSPADGDKTCPSSPDLAASCATSPANCSDSDSGRLHKQLAAAVAANLALQEELSARDFNLAQLAEDFFCLHEQFKQLARHFQAVLGDIQPKSDQSDVKQFAHNHTS